MNKKGFTLAEVLGVIIILGLLVIVSFPPLLNQLKKSKDKLSSAANKILITAAENYMNDHPSQFPSIADEIYYIELSTLVDNGYLKSPIMDAATGETIPEDDNCLKFKISSVNEYGVVQYEEPITLSNVCE